MTEAKGHITVCPFLSVKTDDIKTISVEIKQLGNKSHL
jgi:hypothetical protein